MRLDSVIYLNQVTYSNNDNGFKIKTIESRNQTFAGKKSVRQSEFYQAAASGFNAEITFVIRAQEYNGEREIECDGKIYSVIRTYDVGDKMMEVVCQGVS